MLSGRLHDRVLPRGVRQLGFLRQWLWEADILRLGAGKFILRRIVYRDQILWGAKKLLGPQKVINYCFKNNVLWLPPRLHTVIHHNENFPSTRKNTEKMYPCGQSLYSPEGSGFSKGGAGMFIELPGTQGGSSGTVVSENEMKNSEFVSLHLTAYICGIPEHCIGQIYKPQPF